MSLCAECKRTFPAMLIQPLVTNIAAHPRPMCPICALRLRNALAGLPADTPFTGTMAKRLHRLALDHIAGKEKAP